MSKPTSVAEEEGASGKKIPVRWSAPEVITSMKVTVA
jgi:hypothetical protein